MKTKSLIAVLSAACLALGLVACSGNDDPGESQALTLAAATNEKLALDVVVPMFEEANPGVRVEMTTAALDQYQPTIRTQLASGTAPDIIGVWPGGGNPASMLTLAPGGFLADLSDFERVDEYPEGVRAVSQIDGTTYIAVMAYAGIGPIYNLDALEEAGLEVPTTWSELLQFCTDARETAGRPAFYLGAGTNWNTQLVTYALTPTLVYGPYPDFATEMSEGNRTFANSAWRQSFEQYLELVDHGCFQDDPLGVSYDEVVTAVARGETFGATLVTSGLARIRDEAPEGASFRMEAMPATDDPSETRMAGGAGSAFAINAQAENPELAERFIEFLLSPEVMRAYTEANNTLTAIPHDGEIDPALTTLSQYLAEDKTGPWMDQLWPNARVQATHFEGVQNLLSGVWTIDEALDAMDAAYAQGE